MGSSKLTLEFLGPAKQDGDLGTLGHYRVIDQLGKGGMGFVFRAEDTRLKRTVALKVMNRKIAATPNSRARFISEARSMAAVHHDNVATIFEVGEHNKTPFMAMEMLKGSTLEKFKKAETRPDHQKIIKFAKEMARGLAAAHSQGIVHRDIKPANIWVEAETERIKILDFGLALASTPVDHLAGRGAVIGTPGYLSPEQARSEPLDDRSDLYSVGVVLYELATGKLPLQNKSIAGQLIAILAHPPIPLRDLNPDIPQPLAELIHRLLRKEPRKRIASATELEKCLNQAEIDCESSSEVAQAINKLQMGLSEIVSQKEPEAVEPVLVPDFPDPFASLPDASAESSGSIPGVPAPAAPAATSPRPRKPAGKNVTSKSAANPLQTYLPLVAVAALALVAIPIGIYAFSGGWSSDPIVIGQPDPTPVATNAAVRTNQSAVQPSVPSPTVEQSPSIGTSNNNKASNPAVEATATKISDPIVPGAIVLMDAAKGNGSFETLGTQSSTGGGKSRSAIPGWSVMFKGKKAGFANSRSRAATEGRHYAFANRRSSIELDSDLIDYVTQQGDIYRIAFDVASIPGDGDWKGKSKYVVILGFKESDRANAIKWKLAEIQDQTDIGKSTRTIGFQYVAQDKDIGKKPYVRVTLAESQGRRAESYLDNVRLTVQSKAAGLASAKAPMSESPGMRANPGVNSEPGERMSIPPPPSNNPAVSMMPSETQDRREMENDVKRRMEIVTIRTSDGGADSSVKKGGSKREGLGIRPSLAIQMRGKLEVMHSYLRFNLSRLSPNGDQGNNQRSRQNRQGGNRNQSSKRRETGRAKLVLTVSGKKSAADGQIRVYGISNAASTQWGETGVRAINWKNSFSEAGLSRLPLLAELNLPSGFSKPVVEIMSPELDDFVRSAELNSATFVLAGRSSDATALNFVSREGSKENSPALIVEVPAE